MLIRISNGSMALQRLATDEQRRLRSPSLGRRDVLRGGGRLVGQRVRRAVHHGAGHLQGEQRVGHLVALAVERPQGLSIRNVLPGTITAIDDRGGAIVEVHVRLAATGGGAGRELLSRISRQALDEMHLEAGQPVFALIKAIAFDKRSMGFTA